MFAGQGNSDRGIKIGAVCAAAGVTPRTVRHYESQKLICATGSTPGGQRLYPPETVLTIQAVQALQEIGYSLRQVRRMFATADRQDPQGKQLTVRLRRAARQIEDGLLARLRELQSAQRKVKQLVRSTDGCDSCKGSGCASCGALLKLRTLGLRTPAIISQEEP
jgi:DNA-binding transcriptional MerR regulator